MASALPVLAGQLGSSAIKGAFQSGVDIAQTPLIGATWTTHTKRRTVTYSASLRAWEVGVMFAGFALYEVATGGGSFLGLFTGTGGGGGGVISQLTQGGLWTVKSETVHLVGTITWGLVALVVESLVVAFDYQSVFAWLFGIVSAIGNSANLVAFAIKGSALSATVSSTKP